MIHIIFSTDDYNKARSLTEDDGMISTDPIDINDILDQGE